MNTPLLSTIAISTLSLSLWSACATAPDAPHPVYDFESVFLNAEMRGQKPWKAPDREALRAAVRARAAEANVPALTSVRQRGTLSPRRAPGQTQATTPTRTIPSHLAAHIPSASPASFDDTKAPQRAPGLILGDGSIRGEMASAALRLVGMGPAISQSAFIQHLEKVTATVFPKGRAASEGVVASIWRELRSRGVTYTSDERSPARGDLVFFHHVNDVDRDGDTDRTSGLGVVVRQIDDDTFLCVLPALNAVRQVFVTPQRPSVRREEGVIRNTPIRPRGRADASDVAVLSGELVSGFARL